MKTLKGNFSKIHFFNYLSKLILPIKKLKYLSNEGSLAIKKNCDGDC